MTQNEIAIIAIVISLLSIVMSCLSIYRVRKVRQGQPHG